MEKEAYFEVWLLAAILDGAPFHEILQQDVDIDDFTIEENREIYLALCELQSKGEALSVANCIVNNVPMDPLLEIVKGTAVMSNWQIYVDELKKSSLRRKLKKNMEQSLVDLQNEDPILVQEKLSNQLRAVQPELKIDNISTKLEKWENDILSNTEFKQIIHSGLPDLDRHLAPLSGSRLIFLAGRPGDGKTAIASQIALETSLRGHPVSFFSLETSVSQLLEIFVASSLKISRTRLTLKDVSEFNEKKSSIEFRQLMDSNLFILDDKFHIDKICSTIVYLHKSKNIQLAIIDYIGLIEADRNYQESTTDYLGNISRKLKNLTMTLKIPILVLCQLSRECTKSNRLPVLSDLRSSGSFEQDADCVIMLHRYRDVSFRELLKPGDSKNFDEIKKLEYLSKVLITIEKSRVGAVGEIDDFIFNGRTQRFADKKDYFFVVECST